MSDSSFIDDLVAAAGRHGVSCVVLAGGMNGNGARPAAAVDEDDDDVAEVVAPFMGAPGAVDPSEMEKLRAQVQRLTGELQAAQRAPAAAPTATGGAVPAGDHGNVDSLSVEVLGFEDETLAKKVMRMGYETVGKLREAFMDGKLAEAKLKKDWLVDVGMKLAGAGPSGPFGGGSTPSSTATTAATSQSDAPAGHQDRPWLERLAAAKQKQHELDENRAKLTAKQAEVAKLVKAKKDVPTDLDDTLVALEETIMKDEARMVVLRWTMNLDFDPTISLDESLKRANLGPWMSNPQPRLAPQ